MMTAAKPSRPALQMRIFDPRLHETPPRYATSGSAGLDLRACIEQPMDIAPGASVVIPSGLAVHIKDPGLAAIVLPRSGLGARHGIVLGNLVGLIDSDYQGQILMCLWNRSSETFRLEPMERVAQLVLIPVLQADFTVVDSFEASERGEAGFGSTGRR